MKVLYSIFIGLSLMLIMSSSSIADYEVNGAGAIAVNGLYEDYGTYDTYKSDGLYSNQAMPVHRKMGTDYYLGYRGCSSKWVILELPDGPAGADPVNVDPNEIGGGPGSGYIYINLTDSYTPPSIGWESRHSSPLPVPTVTVAAPPSPDPMTWASAPYGASSSSISMTATIASDPTGPINYYLDFYSSPTGGTGGTDSGWQTSSSYTDSGLNANHRYGYRVRARDGNNFATNYSSITYAYTLANVPIGSSFTNITLTSIQANWSSNGNPSWTEYLCETNISGVTVSSGWITSTSWLCTGLSCGTSYSFSVKARNGDGIESSTNLGSQNTLDCEYPNIGRDTISLSTSCPLGTNAPSQSFDVWNSGTGTLNYSISDNVAWLTCSPTGGSSAGEHDTINVNYATASLASGNYSSTITISASGVTNSPQTIAVDLYVATSEPTADAGPDQYVDEGGTVILDGSNSSDHDDGIVSYLWEQISGTTVTLSGTTLMTSTFVTPIVDSLGDILDFRLTVMDASGLTDSDDVSITINDNGIIDFPPDVLPVQTSTGQSIGIKEESGGTIVSLNMVNPSTIPDSTEKPGHLIYGLIDMQIKVDPSGTTAILIMYLPSPAPAEYTWYKYRPVYGWVDYSKYISFNPARDQITITLVDGGAGDDDMVANRVIIDPSGLGTSHVTPPPEGSEEGGGAGCFIGAIKVNHR